MEKDLPKLVSGKEYYEKHKDTNCHINTKKYFPSLIAINAFLASLKKTNKKPLDDAFKRGFRNLLKAKPHTSKDPKDWKEWKNKILERLSIMSNIPNDLCELLTPPKVAEKKVEPTKRCSTKTILPFEHEPPPPLHTSDKLVSNNAINSEILPLGFSREVYIWKDLFSPITEKLDQSVSDLLETLTSDPEITPHLVLCETAKTYSTKAAIDKPVYTYFLTGGAAYRGLARYLQHHLPSLPALEDIAPRSHDYDYDVYSKDIESLPVEHILKILRSFCESLFKMYRSLFNKIHKISGHEVQFIKPSPCMDRKGVFDYDYEYVEDRFLITSVRFYKKQNEPAVSLSFQIGMTLQITTPTETYCSTDHIFDLSFTKEEKEPVAEQLEIHENPWYPLTDIKTVLSHIAHKQKIACFPTTLTESIHRFQIGKTVYQLPNVNALFLISVHAMVNRGILEDIRFYKSRQDYARMYAILRMMQTLPTNPILSKDEIAYLYTLLKSITVHKDWYSLSDEKKHEMIQMYKEALHDSAKREALQWKTIHTAKIYDRTTKKYKTLHLWSYYTSPYEEFRTNPKSEDPLLWELGNAKFNLRRHIIDTATKQALAKTKRKSCDGTVSTKRKASSHKTRKTKRSNGDN